MKQRVVMLIRHEEDAYAARFPDYPKVGLIYANDASTLLTRGVLVLEDLAKNAPLTKPQTLSAFVFSQPQDVLGSLLTVIEVEFPN